MTATEIVDTALQRCPPLEIQTLEGFLGNLLDQNLDELARLGQPGLVMAAQFTHYARSSVSLAECQRRNRTQADKLQDAVTRLPDVHAPKPRKQKEAADGADSPRAQADAA